MQQFLAVILFTNLNKITQNKVPDSLPRINCIITNANKMRYISTTILAYFAMGRKNWKDDAGIPQEKDERISKCLQMYRTQRLDLSFFVISSHFDHWQWPVRDGSAETSR